MATNATLTAETRHTLRSLLTAFKAAHNDVRLAAGLLEELGRASAATELYEHAEIYERAILRAVDLWVEWRITR